MLDKTPEIHEIHAKWDPEREVSILPKEEYEDWDERWDAEFGEYMNGIQVMKADDAINLLKRMESFK